MLTCWIGFRYRGWHWEVQVGRRVQRHYRVMTEWIDKSACRQVKAGLILPVGIRPPLPSPGGPGDSGWLALHGT